MEINKGKVVYIVILLLFMIILAFFFINVPASQSQAQVYWLLGITGLVSIALGAAFFNFIPEWKTSVPITYEKDTIIGRQPGKVQGYFMLAFLLLSEFVLFNIAASPSLAVINAPAFQIVELNEGTRFLLSIVCAWVEELVLIGLVASLVYGLIVYLTKNKVLGIVIGAPTSATVFCAFHIAVYGFSMPVSMFSVFLYGLFSAFILLTLQNIILMSFVHSANNGGILLAKQIKIGDPMMTFVVIAIITVVLGVLLIRKLGGRGGQST